jgi:hypothetical protein
MIARGRVLLTVPLFHFTILFIGFSPD